MAEGNFINSFLKLFTPNTSATSRGHNTEGTPQRTNIENNWKRPNNDRSSPTLPGTIKPVRSSSNTAVTATVSTDSISSSTPTQPAAVSRISTSTTTSTGEQAHRDSSDSQITAAETSSKNAASSIPPPVPTIDPKLRKFRKILEEQPESCDLETLQKLSWNGIPAQYRPLVWRLLLGYAPLHPARRQSTVERKREEYRQLLLRYYTDINDTNLTPEWLNSATPQEKGLLHQIRIDVPRTLPHNKLFHETAVQKALERILFIWALRHPASSYVQGINDLVAPFFDVFLKEQISKKTALAADYSSVSPQPSVNIERSASGSQSDQTSSTTDTSNDGAESGARRKRPLENADIDLSILSEQDLFEVEADSYWCVTKFIDSIQDNYTFAQPGIQRMIYKLQELINRLDPALHRHLEQHGVQFIQFSFRWMNCLLMRELPLHVVIRMWDTYLAEGAQFPALHTYICAALLKHYSKELQLKDFQEMMLFLQNLPTADWGAEDIEPLVSQAYMWRELYNTAPSHLKS